MVKIVRTLRKKTSNISSNSETSFYQFKVKFKQISKPRLFPKLFEQGI